MIYIVSLVEGDFHNIKKYEVEAHTYKVEGMFTVFKDKKAQRLHSISNDYIHSVSQKGRELEPVGIKKPTNQQIFAFTRNEN